MMRGGMKWIRLYYKVPAKRGARVEYVGADLPRTGVVTGTCGTRLRVRWDGEKFSSIHHPTRNLRFL